MVERAADLPARAPVIVPLVTQTPYPAENPAGDLKRAAGKKLEASSPEYRILKAYGPGLLAQIATAKNPTDKKKLEDEYQKLTARIDAMQADLIKNDADLSKPKEQPVVQSELPTSGLISTMLAKQDWTEGLDQIPATVIDKGVMQFVPYTSFRSGSYEINVYGNPDAPAGIEIGISPPLVDDQMARERCVRFIASLLGDQRAKIVMGLNRAKDSAKLGDLTFEVTPSTDEDAYGAWWISVYSEKYLDASRASPEELRTIAVRRVLIDAAPKPVSPPITVNQPVAAVRERSNDDWSDQEMNRARASSTGGGGSVYVRGYTRKDGTYVQSHSRSAPGSGSHGGGRR